MTNEELLLNILPEETANELKEKYPDVKISLTCNYQWRGLTDGS